MGYSASATLIVGVPYQSLVHHAAAMRKRQKYNQDTGDPYTVDEPVQTIMVGEVDVTADCRKYCTGGRNDPGAVLKYGQIADFLQEEWLPDQAAAGFTLELIESDSDDNPASAFIGIRVEGDWRGVDGTPLLHTDAAYAPVDLQRAEKCRHWLASWLGALGVSPANPGYFVVLQHSY